MLVYSNNECFSDFLPHFFFSSSCGGNSARATAGRADGGASNITEGLAVVLEVNLVGARVVWCAGALGDELVGALVVTCAAALDAELAEARTGKYKSASKSSSKSSSFRPCSSFNTSSLKSFSLRW